MIGRKKLKSEEKQEHSEKLSKTELRKKKREKRYAQSILPYIKLYENGVAEMPDDVYNATIQLNDINYRMVNEEKREEIFSQWMNFINALTTDGGINLTVHNHLISKKGFSDKICLKHRGDTLDHYRDEINTVLLENVKTGNNNIVSDLYLTFALKEESLDDAYRELNVTLTDVIKRLNALGCTVKGNRFLDGKAKLQLLNSIMTPNRDLQFAYYCLDGITTKDVVSPDSFDFSAGSQFKIEDRFCKVLFLKNYSTELNDEIITDFAKLQYNFTINVQMRVMDNAEALELVKKQKAAMEMNKASEQQKAIRCGYDPDMYPDEIKESLGEAKDLMENIIKRNQRLFLCQFVILLNCESENELKEAEKRMRSVAKKHSLELGGITFLQEQGFQAALPLCYSRYPLNRTLPTATASTFIPFSSADLLHMSQHSIYYGVNAASGNLIYCDRSVLLNPNGFIFGKPGSGKSFFVKKEIACKLISDPNCDCIVLDPESEYTLLANLAGIDGTVVSINNSSDIHMNPLAGDMSEKDFIPNKIEFLQSMTATIIGEAQMTPVYISLIDRVGRLMYAKYEDKVEQAKLNKSGCPMPEMPTYTDFYNLMKKQEEKEAKAIAVAIEIYVNGTNNFFAKQSNVDLNNRFIVYETRDLPATMKALAMQVILETTWQRVISNFKKGRSTYIWIDEFHMFMDSKFGRDSFKKSIKRGRKYNAVTTAITQNVEEILQYTDTRTMISNSEFIMMLNQSPLDRAELENMFNISEEQSSYLSNGQAGSGLLKFGTSLVPLIDNFPKNTDLYRAMTTKPDERAVIDQKGTIHV